MTEGRHASDIEDVRNYRGADADTDHFLVCIKYKQRIQRENGVKGDKRKKSDMEKLKETNTVVAYEE
jgi:hypothetical protein